MTGAIDNICTLHYSPYILAPLLERFYESLSVRPNNILLSYLVFPLLMSPKSMVKFKNANSRSSLHTLTSYRDSFFGLEEKVAEFKEITNKSLFLLIEGGGLELGSDMSVSFQEKTLDDSVCSHEQLRAAKNLGIMMTPYDIPTCYRILGVRNI